MYLAKFTGSKAINVALRMSIGVRLPDRSRSFHGPHISCVPAREVTGQTNDETRKNVWWRGTRLDGGPVPNHCAQFLISSWPQTVSDPLLGSAKSERKETNRSKRASLVCNRVEEKIDNSLLFFSPCLKRKSRDPDATRKQNNSRNRFHYRSFFLSLSLSTPSLLNYSERTLSILEH